MSVKIIIDGEGLSYLKDTTIIKASQIIAFLNADVGVMPEDTGYLSTNTLKLESSYINKSPRDAIIESLAKTNAQKILVFAKYNVEKNNQLTFSSNDIRVYFKRAGEPEPKNFGRDIRDAVKQNFIYEEKEGQFVITDFGISLLQMKFESVKIPVTKSKRKSAFKSGKNRIAPTVSDIVRSITILPKMDAIIPYHNISKKSDRILWILYYFYNNSIEELAPTEIEYAANKLVDRIPSGSLSALTETNRKNGFLTKGNDGRYKILFDGIDYLKQLENINSQESRIQVVEGK